MKLLITGILPASIADMAARFVKNGHSVSILGRTGPTKSVRGVDAHNIDPGDARALRLIEAARYQAMIFFFADRCDESAEEATAKGAMLDKLFAIRRAARDNGVERMILVTDKRAFGAGQAGRENETPMPDTPTGMLIKTAEDSLSYGDPGGMHTLIVRVTSLYSPGDPRCFFAGAVKCARAGKPLRLSGTRDTPCDFLHADDLALFLCSALDARLDGAAHIAYGAVRTLGDVEDALKTELPELKIEYAGLSRQCDLLTCSVYRKMDFVPRHDPFKDLGGLLQSLEPPKEESKASALITYARKLLRGALPWLELVLLALVSWVLVDEAQTDATFRFVDFWLFYVVLMGTIHGTFIGAAAAVIACLGYAFDWIEDGYDLYLVIYNLDNWLPMASYLLAGGMFGYLSDKNREQLANAGRELQELSSEETFLKTIYQQAYDDRNQLQEQVMRYRDSYGRIYEITRQLDSMQPTQVFLSTLDVMEDVLQNHTVAIYTLQGNSSFARLMVHSRAIKDLPRSLNMGALPKLRACLESGVVFTNTALEAGYPAMASPLRTEGGQSAFIALWDASFDKQSLYYSNLFSVVSGLVESAVSRAFNYVTVSEDTYVENTHMLSDAAFRRELDVYRNMRKRDAGSYLLMRVRSDRALSPEEYDRRISMAIRTTDEVGMMDDGAYCVLFPQASEENLPQITARFVAQGLSCEPVSREAEYA